MDLTLSNVMGLVALTLRNPRAAAQTILRVPLPMVWRWGALVLMATLSAVVMQAVQALLPPQVLPDGTVSQPVPPVIWAVMVAVGMSMTVFLIHAVGRWRGGRGELADAVILVAWLQFIQLLAVLVQVLLMTLLPVAVPLAEIGGVLLFVWLLVHFVAEMHGFRSLGLVFLGILLTFVAAVLALTFVLMSLGVAP